jgi:hypothetical protein
VKVELEEVVGEESRTNVEQIVPDRSATTGAIEMTTVTNSHVIPNDNKSNGKYEVIATQDNIDEDNQVELIA